MDLEHHCLDISAYVQQDYAIGVWRYLLDPDTSKVLLGMFRK